MTEQNIIETEKSLLSAIMYNQEILYRVNIKPDDMIHNDHRLILDACVKLSNNGTEPDLTAVCNYLHGSVNPGYVAEITNYGAMRTNWIHYAKKLIESIMIRKLERLPSVISDLISSGNESKEVISQAGEYLDSVSVGFSDYRITGIKDFIPDMVDEFEKKVAVKGAIEGGVKSGFPTIDDATGGWKNKNLIYVGARPSQGKSALLCNMAVSALDDNAIVGVITVESSKEEIATRMISCKSQTPLHSLKTGMIGNRKLATAIDTYAWIHSKKLFFYDEPNANIMTVIAQARRMVAVHKIDILFVDYCQLIYPVNRSVNRIDQVSDVSIRLKQLARDLDIPVVCAAQLRRDAENRSPMLSDFADSSQLEKDADIAILIHHKSSGEDGETESFLHLDKHRDGQTVSVPVDFIRETVTFRENGNVNER